MITNSGKNIIAKYLVGQSPAYASYIAVGCGAKPLEADPEVSFGDYSDKSNLDFEMFRVPITSRGYIKDEDGIAKIVLTAELPTEERYEISEIGVYSAGANPTAGAYDSKTLFAFSDSENWKYDNQISLDSKYDPLDSGGTSGEIHVVNTDGSDVMAFKTNANNRIFTNAERVARYERCRFLNNILITNGSMSNISTEMIDGVKRLKVNSGSHYVGITGTTLNLSKNAPTDELRLAFSVVNKNKVNTSPINPDKVYIMIEFSDTDVYGEGQWARFEVILDSYDFATNRYIISTKQLQELRKNNTGFNWDAVTTVKLYTSVIVNNNISDDFYICFDAIRLENTTSINPLYGLVGYSVIKNDHAETIVKAANTTSYIEFRFGMNINNG
jgi:hypothetical protein